MRLFNLILDSKKIELSTDSIPIDLRPIYENLLQQNLVSLYLTPPLGKSLKIDYPVVTFLSPLFAKYVNTRNTLESRILQIRLDTDRKIEEIKLENDRKIEQIKLERDRKI